MELNLAVGEINCVSPHFIPPTFNTYIKILDTYIIEAHFEWQTFKSEHVPS